MSQQEKDAQFADDSLPLERRGFQQKALWGPENTSFAHEHVNQSGQREPAPTSPPSFASPPLPSPTHLTSPQQTRKAAPPVKPPLSGQRPVAPQLTALLRGQTVPYKVRVSPKARVLRLVIRQESGLEIVVPRGTRRAQIDDALQQKADWILRTMQRVMHETTTRLPPLEDGRELPFLGRTLKLVIVINAHRTAGHPRVALTGTLNDMLMVSLAESERHDQHLLRAALEHWYRRQAQDIIPVRLVSANQKYGFSYGRVTIKEQKSRWGSCSRAGNLNFNWRLLLAPLPVLDYVLIHELAHLKELNHAPPFWRLVASACPDYERQRRWLREYGRTLRF